MAKFYGKIGFADMVETRPGTWMERIIERNYFGEINRISQKFQGANQLNDNINFSNELSVLIEPFLEEHTHVIRYVEFMGAKWKVNNIEIRRPRLILTIGGLYNGGEQA